MTRLYLIRHARPASSWGGDDDDPGLDEIGKGQARSATERLLALPAGERPTRVVSSPLRRCRQTAQPLADALSVEATIDPAVGEIPTPRAMAHAERPAWLRAAFAGDWADIRGDIDYVAWRHAVAAALASHEGCAVFSHFVAINAVISLLTADSRVIVFRPDHVSITTLELATTGLRLIERGAQAATGVL